MSPRYRIRRTRGLALVWRLLQGGALWRWECRDPKCPTAILNATIADGLRYGHSPSQQAAIRRVETHERQWHRGTL